VKKKTTTQQCAGYNELTLGSDGERTKAREAKEGILMWRKIETPKHKCD